LSPVKNAVALARFELTEPELKPLAIRFPEKAALELVPDIVSRIQTYSPRSGVHVFGAITFVMIVSLKMSKRLARLQPTVAKARSAQAEAQPPENMGPSPSLPLSTKNSKK
jgi:hypothetical protein